MDPYNSICDLQRIESNRTHKVGVINQNMVEQPKNGKNNNHEFLFFGILNYHT